MGKLGDLFVRLGLKSDGYKKGIADAKKETKSFGDSLGKMKAGAAAVWAVIGAAVIKFGQDFIGATNKVGDAWEATMANIKAQYQTVLAEMTNYKPDFSSFRNFFKNEWKWIKETIFNAKEAGDAASEMTKSFDQQFELTQSIRIQRGAIQQELNELYAKMRDTTLDAGSRQAAAEQYKALLKPLADAEIAVYKDMLNNAVTAWTAGTGLNRTQDEIIEFFTNIGTHADQMKAKYADIANVFDNKKGDKQNIVIYDVLAKYQDASNQMSNVDKEMARTTNSIKENIKKSLEDIANAVKEYGSADIPIELKASLSFNTEKIGNLQAQVKGYEDQIKSALDGYKIILTELSDAGVLQRSEQDINNFLNNIVDNTNDMLAKYPDIAAFFTKSSAEIKEALSSAEIKEIKIPDVDITPIVDLILEYHKASDEITTVGNTIANVNRRISQSMADLDIDIEMDLDIEELDFSELDAEIKAFADSWHEECMKIANMNQMLEQSLISSFSNGMQAFTDFIMGVEGASAEQVLAAFIQPLADTMKQMGEMFMAEGIAMAAFKDSIKNPYALIAAGAALIAVSSVVSSGLAKLTANPAGGTSASSASAAGSSTSGKVETFEQDITVHVVGTISGNNIVLAGQKTLNKWNR